jgi:3-isopropylmalate/(R)-2-methylmalate dehydratase small subunit
MCARSEPNRFEPEFPIMQPFTVLEGVAAPLMRTNINTDIIIRIERLRDLAGDKLGPYAFESWRYRPDGSEDPAFVLNKPAYREARILIAGDNFACGSSREAALWALQAFGIRAVIAPSFGAIFFSNCFQNGVLPVVLPAKVVDELAAEVEATQGRGKVKVDLERCVVVSPGGKESAFSIDAMLREGMLKGLDRIELTRAREGEIAAFQARDRASHPWIYALPR